MAGGTTARAVAVETGDRDAALPGTVIRTASGQQLTVEDAASALPGLVPTVGHLLPSAPSGAVAARGQQFAPAMRDGASFVDVLSAGSTAGNLEVDYAALGLPLNPKSSTSGIVEVTSFDVVLGTPMANPTYQVVMSGTRSRNTDSLQLVSSTGPGIVFGDAYDSAGNIVETAGVARVSGLQGATAVQSGRGWMSSSFLGAPGTGTLTDLLRAQVPWLAPDAPEEAVLSGTVRLDTGGRAVERVTVKLVSRFYRDGSAGDATGYLPNIAIAVAVPTEVSALPRLLPGTSYGHATHHMPVVGEDNLHLGATIVESRSDLVTTALGSGTATDNSDAGFDGLGSFFLCDDHARRPVATLGPSHAGARLCTTVAVSGARSERAFVAGYVDFTGAGSFAGPASRSVEVSAPLVSGSGLATLRWTVPTSGLAVGDMAIRLRTSYAAEGVAASGGSPTGEVEDYTGRLSGEDRGALSLSKTSSLAAGSVVRPGDTFSYDLTVTNASGTAQTGIVVNDDLPAGLEYVVTDDADAWTSTSATSATAVINIPADAAVTLAVSVRVTAGAAGVLRNVAVLDDQDAVRCLDAPTALCGVDPWPPTVEEAEVPGPGETDPTVPAPGETDPTVPAPGETDPTVPAPGETDPAVPGPGETDPTVPAPGETDPAVPGPGETDPTVPAPGETEPAVPAPGETEPAASADPEPGPSASETPEPAGPDERAPAAPGRADDGPVPPSPDRLASTGSDGMPAMIGLAALLLLAGTMMLAARPRRVR